MKFLKAHTFFLFFFFIFCLLLFKDVFSARTLISNMEPFPDSIHYVNAVRSLLSGDGLFIVREGRALATSVPPLYSFFLAPAYILNNDPRMFYFINVLLALASYFIFYRLLIILVNNSIIRNFILFLYITNYYLYWFPNLAMAENLILFLFVSFLMLLLSKASRFNIFMAGLLAISFYATKYASVPLTACALLAYFIKLIYLWRNGKLKIKGFLLFFSSSFIAFMAFSLSEYITKNVIPFSFLITFGSNFSSQTSQSAEQVSAAPRWFSLVYAKENISHYLNVITGGSERFLWDFSPMAPRFVAISGLLGLILGILTKTHRLISITLLIMLVSSVLFMSTFYSVDMRYIYQTIPTLLLGFGIFMQIIVNRIKKPQLKILFYIGLAFLIIFYFSLNALRIKNQIMLNIKHSETPWYYMTVQELNKYFTSDKILVGKKPIVISPIPPYYIDFFSNGNYTLMPLSPQQEFRNSKETVYGPNDYSDLIKLYQTYIKNGYGVYVNKYGIGNESYLNEDFQNIVSRFKLIEVASGCFDACNIYKVELKTGI
ncbi:MAG: hypothetical protein WCV81_01990 [Microgenomates group bacterium]|jgi:hypothetical protein